MKNVLITTLCVLFAGGVALGDWYPGDDHKMHFPQLPNPNGWDVDFSDPRQHDPTAEPKVLADDWQCSEAGPVKDIHFWFSSYEEGSFLPIYNVHASIHSNDISDTFPKPGGLLWERDFGPGEFVVNMEYGFDIQGWYDPSVDPEQFEQFNHFNFHQINIVEIADPFPQELGEIYWLDLTVSAQGNLATKPAKIGWKTSLDEFGGNAVWREVLPSGDIEWHALTDPVTGERLDLAFVITPEPATLSLLALGGLAVLRRRRRR